EHIADREAHLAAKIERAGPGSERAEVLHARLDREGARHRSARRVRPVVEREDRAHRVATEHADASTEPLDDLDGGAEMMIHQIAELFRTGGTEGGESLAHPGVARHARHVREQRDGLESPGLPSIHDVAVEDFFEDMPWDVR